DILPRKLAREDLKEDLEAFGIRGWHYQIDASAILGRDRTVQIDVFADELGGHTGPGANRRPARANAIHAADARLISEHDARPLAAALAGGASPLARNNPLSMRRGSAAVLFDRNAVLRRLTSAFLDLAIYFARVRWRKRIGTQGVGTRISVHHLA